MAGGLCVGGSSSVVVTCLALRASPDLRPSYPPSLRHYLNVAARRGRGTMASEHTCVLLQFLAHIRMPPSLRWMPGATCAAAWGHLRLKEAAKAALRSRLVKVAAVAVAAPAPPPPLPLPLPRTLLPYLRLKSRKRWRRQHQSCCPAPK